MYIYIYYLHHQHGYSIAEPKTISLDCCHCTADDCNQSPVFYLHLFMMSDYNHPIITQNNQRVINPHHLT